MRKLRTWPSLRSPLRAKTTSAALPVNEGANHVFRRTVVSALVSEASGCILPQRSLATVGFAASRLGRAESDNPDLSKCTLDAWKVYRTLCWRSIISWTPTGRAFPASSGIGDEIVRHIIQKTRALSRDRIHEEAWWLLKRESGLLKPCSNRNPPDTRTKSTHSTIVNIVYRKP